MAGAERRRKPDWDAHYRVYESCLRIYHWYWRQAKASITWLKTSSPSVYPINVKREMFMQRARILGVGITYQLFSFASQGDFLFILINSAQYGDKNLETCNSTQPYERMKRKFVLAVSTHLFGANNKAKRRRRITFFHRKFRFFFILILVWISLKLQFQIFLSKQAEYNF